MQIIQSIQKRIFEIRSERVMLDFDIAHLYEVETKVLNQAVKRNITRFPDDFMFQLTTAEWSALRSQLVTLEVGRGQFTKYLPYAFTEQGVAMLSGVLRSEKAISMNIAIMRAFVAVRKVISLKGDLKKQVEEIRDRLGEHDVQLSQIYDALENLMDEKAAQKKWDDRQRIGFKTDKIT